MINRFKPDYFRMVPDESGEFVYFWHHMEALKSAMEAQPSPATPNATARLVEALRAIVEAVDEEGELWDIPLGLYNDANNALHVAQPSFQPGSQAECNAIHMAAMLMPPKDKPIVPPFPSSISDPRVAICNKSLADSVLTVLVNVAGVMDGEIPENIKQQVHSVIKAAILGTGEPAERPVVPVSEDVDTIREILSDLFLWANARDKRIEAAKALAALDRLAAAAGRKE